MPLYHRALAAGLPAARDGAEPRRRRKRDLYRRRYRDRLRYGSGQRPLDDFVLRRARRSVRRRWPSRSLGPCGRADGGRFHATTPISPAPAPKSLDRSDFHAAPGPSRRCWIKDGAATLAAFTVESVVASLRHVPKAPRRWLVTGGGRRNAHFMQRPARPPAASMSIRSRPSAGTATSWRRRPSVSWRCAPCAASP